MNPVHDNDRLLNDLNDYEYFDEDETTTTEETEHKLQTKIIFGNVTKNASKNESADDTSYIVTPGKTIVTTHYSTSIIPDNTSPTTTTPKATVVTSAIPAATTTAAAYSTVVPGVKDSDSEDSEISRHVT